MSFSFLRSQDPQNFKNEDHVLFVSPGISNLKKAVIIYTGPLAVSRVKTKVETLFPAFASKVPLEVVKPRNPKVGGPTSD